MDDAESLAQLHTAYANRLVENAALRAECDALRAVVADALEHANFVDSPEGRDYSYVTSIRGCLLTVRDILKAAAPRKEGTG